MLADFTQALEQIARATPAPARPNEEIFKRKTGQPSERPMLAGILGRLGALMSWSLTGLLTVVCIAVIGFARPSSDGRAVQPTTPSSVDVARADPGVQQSLVAQTAAQGAG